MAVSPSSRTPLMALLRRCFREAARPEEARTGGPRLRMDRREFLKGAAVLGTAAMLPGCRGSGAAPAGGPRVAIVGAGIAGLSAAHHLAKAGIRAEIYEAGHRPGGRIMTLKGVMGPDLFTEAGGEFIDSTHADLLGLAREMGLSLADMQGEAYAGYRATAWRFGGRHRSESEVLAEVRLAAGRLKPDIDALPGSIAAGTGGVAGELDLLSLEEYLQRRGITGWFGDLLETAYATEFGLDAGEQSCLNLLTMADLDASGPEFRVYGDSDERFRVEGGNQQITDALGRKHESSLRYGHRLEALDGGSGGYRLHFQGPSGAVEKRADAVILALPFTLLRSVELRLELPPGKRRAIAELGMGTNAKLFVGYGERPWRKNGYLGGFHTDGAVQGGWDHTQTQPGDEGGLTVFQGGRAGADLGAGTPLSRAEAFADELEALFPGSRAARNGRVGVFHWPTFPLSLGSYSCYRPGQWTGIGGEEGRSVGDLHFAGEHCSAEFQGYMNGGAETGRLAAEAVLRKAGTLRG